MSTTTIFSDADKFDGTNLSLWRRLIHTAATSQGVFGYLDGTILCPTSLPDPKTPIPKTTWDLESPTLKKWRLHDAWTLGLLIFNTKNPAGLGINIDGTATEA